MPPKLTTTITQWKKGRYDHAVKIMTGKLNANKIKFFEMQLNTNTRGHPQTTWKSICERWSFANILQIFGLEIMSTLSCGVSRCILCHLLQVQPMFYSFTCLRQVSAKCMS